MRDGEAVIVSRRYYTEPLGKKDRSACGGDELQALITALLMAGRDLVLNREKFGSKLRWEGGWAESSLPMMSD